MHMLTSSFKKQLVVDMTSLNLTHTTPSLTSTSNKDTPHVTTELVPLTNLEQDYNSFRVGQSNCGGHNNRGRGGRFPNSNVQCQVCTKFNHIDLNRWNRFN